MSDFSSDALFFSGLKTWPYEPGHYFIDSIIKISYVSIELADVVECEI